MRNIKNEQSGRSMIEMLGVLAIIGVLSVGGIAGYSKAMHKYRINKTIEQITLIAGNVRSFFAPQRSYADLVLTTNNTLNYTLIQKAKLMPNEMWDDTDKEYKNVFGYNVDVRAAHKSTSGDKQAFYISFGLPDNDYEACIELLSQDWNAAGVKGIVISGPTGSAVINVPAEMDDVVSKCAAKVSKYNLSVKLYFDVNSNCWREHGEHGCEGNCCS